SETVIKTLVQVAGAEPAQMVGCFVTLLHHGRAVVWAGIDFPVVFTGAGKCGCSSVRTYPGNGVIAGGAIKNLAPHHRHAILAIRRHRNTAAFAAVISNLAVGCKAGTLIAGYRVEHGAAVITLASGGSGFQFALVQPGQIEMPRFGQEQAVKTVAGQQAIILHRANGFTGLAAISRAGETDVAGMHALGFLRPGHIDHFVLACTAVHNNLGTVFTIDLNGFRNSIDPYRLTVAGTVIVRMYQPGNLVLDK